MTANAGIRAVLTLRGYNQTIHERGWSLTMKAAGHRKPTPTVVSAPEVAAARAAIDKWDEPTFRVAHAALATDFPAQDTFVFQDLTAAVGAASMVSVSTFLDRLDALESSKDTRKVDHAALAKLAERGIHAEERARMRGLLVTARGTAEAAEAINAAAPEEEQAAAAEQRASQIEAWRFFNEWSEIARADIKRRDWLIQAGLAKRKPPKKKSGGDK